MVVVIGTSDVVNNLIILRLPVIISASVKSNLLRVAHKPSASKEVDNIVPLLSEINLVNTAGHCVYHCL